MNLLAGFISTKMLLEEKIIITFETENLTYYVHFVENKLLNNKPKIKYINKKLILTLYVKENEIIYLNKLNTKNLYFNYQANNNYMHYNFYLTDTILEGLRI